jgi:pectate lyase
MPRQRLLFLQFVSLLVIAQGSFAADFVPAFPGAEGFGAVATGGRGGRVIKVTNLNSNGPGSLQAACAEEGPRIVVFEVGGVIRGDIQIMHSNITIAGQSAPSPGITIVGRILSRYVDDVRLKNIVIRHLRVRPPPTTGVGGDAIQLSKTERVMLDHLSLAWANDEMIDIIHSSEITIQWCTIEESDLDGHAKGNDHNFAVLSAYADSGNVSIHHNLFAHHSRRLPSIAPAEKDKHGDFRNNVIYNFRDGLSHEGHTPRAAINLVANYYKRGPNSKIIYPFNLDQAGQYYIDGNYIEGIGTVGDPRNRKTAYPMWFRPGMNGGVLLAPAPVAAVTTDAAKPAYQKVMQGAGAWPRDRVTKRTIEEVQDSGGRWGRNAPRDPSDKWLLDGLISNEQDVDADNDGIPDKWEVINGLDPSNPGDNNQVMPNGYPAIETYLHERANSLLR